MKRSLSQSRREFLQQSATQAITASALGLTLGSSPNQESLFASEEKQKSFPKGKAEHCIFIWLGGGACHIDTWDPKRKGDPKAKKPGSYYDPIKTAIEGVEVCEHLPRCADILDRFNPVRTVHHEVIDEHAAATNRVHTGYPTGGTLVYPSVGSIVAHERGAAADGVPAYILIGYPNVTRGPGFLGAKDNFVYLLDTNSKPAGLSRPAGITESRQLRRERLLEEMRKRYRVQHSNDKRIVDYDTSVAQALKLGGPQFMNVFALDREPDSVRESYGGEFGQRCLLARRLLEAGTRFVEVSHNLNFVNGTGWDTHNEGQLKQHLLIKELDHALSGLVLDLEKKKMLDKTLIVVATEFGRPAKFDGGGGRGHQSKAYSMILAGGGLNNGKAIGETDELGAKIVSRPVSIPDFHATMYCTLGIDPSKELYAGDRPVYITNHGEPLRELFS